METYLTIEELAAALKLAQSGQPLNIGLIKSLCLKRPFFPGND
jgi:hypothetical protein